MNRIILTILVLALAGCAPRYTWRNSAYGPGELEDSFHLDRGDCVRQANASYPDPYPVTDPGEIYHDCMVYNTRQDTVVGRNEDGEIVYRTITRRPPSYACMPSFSERERFRRYQEVLNDQRRNRAQYVESCLSSLGWDKIPVED